MNYEKQTQDVADKLRYPSVVILRYLPEPGGSTPQFDGIEEVYAIEDYRKALKAVKQLSIEQPGLYILARTQEINNEAATFNIVIGARDGTTMCVNSKGLYNELPQYTDDSGLFGIEIGEMTDAFTSYEYETKNKETAK